MFCLTQIYSHTFISINLENFLTYSQVKIRVNYSLQVFRMVSKYHEPTCDKYLKQKSASLCL